MRAFIRIVILVEVLATISVAGPAAFAGTTIDEAVWLHEHAGDVFDELLPLSGTGFWVAARGYDADLEAHYAFAISIQPDGDNLRAVYRRTVAGTLVEQIQSLHRQFPERSAIDLAGQVQMTLIELSGVDCPRLHRQFKRFSAKRYHPPAVYELTIHGSTFQLKAEFSGGYLDVTLRSQDNEFVRWANDTRAVIETCNGQLAKP